MSPRAKRSAKRVKVSLDACTPSQTSSVAAPGLVLDVQDEVQDEEVICAPILCSDPIRMLQYC